VTRDRARRAFARPAYLFVRVLPEGFLVNDDVETELAGRIVKSHLIRKLFEDGVLDCQSRDGITSASGKSCDECKHPRCRAGLRIHLRDGPVVYVVDLAVSAARDCLDLLDTFEAEGRRPEDVSLRLTVTDQGRWGWVRLEPVDPS